MIIAITIFHVIVCILLMFVVLIQAGRGGGFVEGFAGVESVFGTKTSAFLTRTTAILSTLFFITCLSLAILSARQGKSLMQDVKVAPKESTTVGSKPASSAPVAEGKEAVGQGPAASAEATKATGEMPKSAATEQSQQNKTK